MLSRSLIVAIPRLIASSRRVVCLLGPNGAGVPRQADGRFRVRRSWGSRGRRGRGAPPWPVPGDGLVRTDGVVLDAVFVGVTGEVDCVGISSRKSRSYFRDPNPRSREPLCPGVLTRSALPQRGVGGDGMLELERAERAAIVGDDRDRRHDLPSASHRQASISAWPNSCRWSTRARSAAAIASCWFPVGETCQRCS